MNSQNLSPPPAPIGEALPALSPQPQKFAPSVILGLAGDPGQFAGAGKHRDDI